MSHTRRRGVAQAPNARPHAIPSPADPGALSVSDGAIHLGWVVPSDGSFFAFNYRAKLIGEYRTQLEASRAIPFVDDVGRDS